MRSTARGGCVVDPPAPGRLQEGWLRKRRKRPPGPSTRPTSATASSSVLCARTRAGDHGVGRRRPGREGRPPRPQEAGPRLGPGPRRAAPGRGRRDGLCAPTPRSSASRAIWPSRCPHRARSGSRPGGRRPRQDLLHVLGVGPVRERRLPPAGGVLPQLPSVTPPRGCGVLVHGSGHALGEPRERHQLPTEARRTAVTPPSSFTSRLRRTGRGRDVVEGAAGHALGPQLAVIGDGKAVRLVTDALQQVQASDWRGMRTGSRRLGR